MRPEKPKMLIIGARGFLGTYVAEAAGKLFDVIEGNRSTTGRPGEVAIDVKDAQSVNSAFRTTLPDVVLLLAAISDIDYCEKVPDEARAVNLRGAELVANACARSKARLVFTSTGAVFDGKQHGYTEESPVSPVSVYGHTKAEAERMILTLLPESLVLRIALAIGFARNPGHPALLDNWKQKLQAGKCLSFPVFEQRNPIDPWTFSHSVLDLLNNAVASGIFHIGCQDPVTRYDLGREIAVRMGYVDRIEAQTAEIPGRAPRGPDHYLLTGKLQATSTIPIPTSSEVIERCFDGIA
jgi:dTDP-4-dehydrorhamnose reductase